MLGLLSYELPRSPLFKIHENPLRSLIPISLSSEIAERTLTKFAIHYVGHMVLPLCGPTQTYTLHREFDDYEPEEMALDYGSDEELPKTDNVFERTSITQEEMDWLGKVSIIGRNELICGNKRSDSMDFSMK
jgi:hypothetical protein